MSMNYINTDLGRTALYSNDRMFGKHRSILLYLHGGPGSPDPHIVQYLDYNGWIFTYDQFGCGKSDYKEIYDPDLFVNQLHELIEKEFRNDQLILMGASWGGTLACLYLEKYGTERIKALILASPMMDENDSETQRQNTISSLPSEIQDAIRKGNELGFFGETYALAKRAFFKEEYGRHDTEESTDWSFRPTNEVYRQMWGPDESACTGTTKGLSVIKGLESIDVPVLYISGDKDIHCPEDVRRYASKIKDVELHILEDTGHYVASHPDYDEIIRNFTNRIDKLTVEDKEDHDFYLQKDYDMILYDSPHDTLANLELKASRMTDEECMAEAKRYETGDGVPQSLVSARVFLNAIAIRSSEYSFGSFPRVTNRIDYDSSYDKRRLILSPRGIESTCCKAIREVIGGSGFSNGEGYIARRDVDYKDPASRIRECPFCGCKLEILKPDQIVKIQTKDEFARIKKDYIENPHTLDDTISIYSSLTEFCTWMRESFPDFNSKRRELDERISALEKEHIQNVTGVLARSTSGFESSCCKDFADNFKTITSWQKDPYYVNIEMRDGKRLSRFKICPYCNSRMKRVPRTY